MLFLSSIGYLFFLSRVIGFARRCLDIMASSARFTVKDCEQMTDNMIEESGLTLSMSHCGLMDCVACSMVGSPFICGINTLHLHGHAQYFQTVYRLVDDIVNATPSDDIVNLTLGKVAAMSLPNIVEAFPRQGPETQLKIWHRFFVGDDRRCRWVLSRIACRKKACEEADDQLLLALQQPLATPKPYLSDACVQDYARAFLIAAESRSDDADVDLRRLATARCACSSHRGPYARRRGQVRQREPECRRDAVSHGGCGCGVECH